MMIHEILIPECYVWMTAGSSSRVELFKSYVRGYLAKSHAGMELVKIKGMVAVCVKK